MKRFHRTLCIISMLLSASGCTSMFFQPITQHMVSPADYYINYQDIFFKSADNLTLHGWWFPATEESKAIVVFLEGNSGNISSQASAVYWLTQHKYEVFIFDYRGYGKSEGVAFLQGALSDIEQAILYAAKKNQQQKKLFVIGQSLGASMGVFAVSEMKQGIDAAIFVSPFSDYREMTREFLSRFWLTWALQWPLSLTINNDYRPLDYVATISPVPLLFLYSDTDEVVPSSQTKALYEKAEWPKAIEPMTGTHNTLMSIQENRDIILRYLDAWSENSRVELSRPYLRDIDD